MSLHRNLLDQARENARKAREHAHFMYGGGGGESKANDIKFRRDELETQKAINQSIEKARREIRQHGRWISPWLTTSPNIVPTTTIIRQQVDEAIKKTQNGGYKNMVSPTTMSQQNGQLIAKNMLRVLKNPTVRNEIRSYTVTVNGHPLDQLETVTGVKHYYHGPPTSASRKVVSYLGKKLKMYIPSLDQSVEIVLTEVSKGGQKMYNKRNTYHYYGWRETISPIDTKRTDKHGHPILVRVKNIVIPTYGTTRHEAMKIYQNR